MQFTPDFSSQITSGNTKINSFNDFYPHYNFPKLSRLIAAISESMTTQTPVIIITGVRPEDSER